MTTYAVIATATNICDNVVVWDDNLGPWNSPADNYIVNIDCKEVGIGFYYDPATQVWTAPPSITASFSPSPIFLTQTTVLTWDAANATSVTLSDSPGQTFPANDSKSYTPTTVGKVTVTITATGLAGTTSTFATVNVVATQAELAAAGNPSVI
jgi:hypothetical protein